MTPSRETASVLTAADPPFALSTCASVFAGDLEIGIIEDGDISLHPRMDVALHGDGNFGTREALHNRRRPRGLRFVPFAIVHGDGMDIVGGRIGIDDREGLARLQRENV